ncbi:unnamed protein product [Rotaria sp. Silwood1]|nr:unnamed protein product [Rotaria sp. Silwood1]CAF0844233.1 unnamed protein product [Rotaria sp. Silwood1]CAF3364817.1 unnamed protein product [Rotaria sp. Silwood1]CAF3365431.1 unnamed protein product [Rotaria sp. Silwood1]CAF3369342.1 unnamed protein product [Rotaria sp. Silwood1]
MLVIKRCKQHDRSPTQSSSSSHRLFADYPYPTLTKLEKTCEQQQKLYNHSHTPISLRRYKDYLNKMLSTLNSLHHHNSPISTPEQIVQQTDIDRYLSKAHVNNSQQKNRPTDNKQLFVSSTNSMIHVHNGQNNEQDVKGQNITNLDYHINYNKG